MLETFLKDESGASAAEYALILCISCVGLGAAALQLGANVEAAIGGAANNVYATSQAAGSVKAGPYVAGKPHPTGGGSAAVTQGGNADTASGASDSGANVTESPSAQQEVSAASESPSNGNHYGQCKKGKC